MRQRRNRAQREALIAAIDGAQWSQLEVSEDEDRDQLRAAVNAMGQDL